MSFSFDPEEIDASKCNIHTYLRLDKNGDMYLSDIQTFLEHYGACGVDIFQPDECIKQMASQVNPVILGDKPGHYFWTDFKRPRTRRAKNIPVGFEPIQRIVDAVSLHTTTNLQFTLVPQPDSSPRQSSADDKIDTCYLQASFSYKHASMDICVPVELKQERTTRNRDGAHLHALAACHRLLMDDPRRMWIYAMTIEGPMMSLWYFSKSHSVKSVAFNWIEDPATFVRILLMFANATMEELGLDPSIHLSHESEGGVSHIHEVPIQGSEPLLFKATKPLSIRRPMRIANGTRRVWGVVQVSSADGERAVNSQTVNSKKLVLKDIRKDPARKALAPNVRRCSSVFSDHGDLEESPEFDADVTPQTPWPDEVDGDTAEVRSTINSFRRFAPKRHSRIICEEIWTTLQDLDTVGEVVDFLCQAVDALQTLAASGWVHRDISTTNIMAFRPSADEPWTVKLADLESARLMMDATREPGRDPRVGTPFFMPVEILSRQYLFEEYIRSTIDNLFFPPRTTLATQLGIQDDDVRFPYINAFMAIPFDKDTIRVPTNLIRTVVPTRGSVVIHNFQHDLESIWWILLWIATSRVGCRRSARTVAHVFTHDVNDSSHGRRGMLKSRVPTLPFLEDLETGVVQLLEALRVVMFQDYILRPIFGDLGLAESYSNIHAKFAEYFHKLRSRGGPWQAVKLERAQHSCQPVQASSDGLPNAVAGTKHERDPSTSEDRRPNKRRKGGRRK